MCNVCLELDKLNLFRLTQQDDFTKRIKRINTQRYYTQHKFNLIREENEGYSKLLTFLHQSKLTESTLLSVISSTIGLFSLLHGVLPFSMDVDQSFIAAILTIIGYSINDKVVIFDRIREYQTLYPKRNIKDNINNAINSTLTRTINTSGTTLVVLLAIFLFGGEVIRGFVFALLFGVLISIYSTVFTATPVAYDLIRRKEKEETK